MQWGSYKIIITDCIILSGIEAFGFHILI